MKLGDVCAAISALRFPHSSEAAHPDREAIVQVRSCVRGALASDEFLADCLGHELRLVESGRPRQGLTPFFTMPDLGIRFAFGYWSPGATPGPHEHTAWTITAVCCNRLSVSTFDRAESYRRNELVAKNLFEAEAGQVGFIYEPSIHEPKNTSSDWSLSLHITSPRDGSPVDGVEPLAVLTSFPRSAERPVNLGDPLAHVRKMKARHQEIQLLTRTLLASRTPAATVPLASCFQLGTSSTRRMLAAALPNEFPDLHDGVLTRTHPDLRLTLQHGEHGCVLAMETPNGWTKMLGANVLAREALAFAAARSSFEVSALPGDLDQDERIALADLLEDVGLFKRIAA